ncbi:DUF111 domain containing protein [Nitzschia inconspicua]|uniref:DUF111 domain containing protein n=1 Tax=Nitzschia inconspicua TaxID=303405 RepID=A0A9K3Q866_9STRA|nr:DUF111 domain containing protein [Nitzschia inconspicua]
MTSHDQGQIALWDTDQVATLEANMDDITGEHLSHVMEMLMNNGALDVWATPIIMKKGRPAHTLHCLCHNDEASMDKFIKLIFQHSTTLGIRIYPSIQRAKLERFMLRVDTAHSEHPIKVKISKFRTSDEIVSAKAEFDDCKRIMLETGVPVNVVAEEAIHAAKQLWHDR